MKRAEVFKARINGATFWHIDVTTPGHHIACDERDTHAEALAVAIKAVGLAPGNPEPLEAP